MLDENKSHSSCEAITRQESPALYRSFQPFSNPSFHLKCCRWSPLEWQYSSRALDLDILWALLVALWTWLLRLSSHSSGQGNFFYQSGIINMIGIGQLCLGQYFTFDPYRTMTPAQNRPWLLTSCLYLWNWHLATFYNHVTQARAAFGSGSDRIVGHGLLYPWSM